ncbi:hypothetical protein B0H16DRAFT_548523 [Mycena metata]|uniref:Uncharacterized protein n=1 Tax=Mycena metata TaxID=1033252 RepID=A0AAD7JC10_9AGAR|nr:hypothetical protein B0H16DRAFT_548523 [Mycena metata]
MVAPNCAVFGSTSSLASPRKPSGRCMRCVAVFPCLCADHHPSLVNLFYGIPRKPSVCCKRRVNVFPCLSADHHPPMTFFAQPLLWHPQQALRVPRVPRRRLSSSLPHTARSPIFLHPNCPMSFPSSPPCTASAASTSSLVAATDPAVTNFFRSISPLASPASHPCAASAASTSFLVVAADRDTPRLFSVELLAGILRIHSVRRGRRVNLLARR